MSRFSVTCACALVLVLVASTLSAQTRDGKVANAASLGHDQQAVDAGQDAMGRSGSAGGLVRRLGVRDSSPAPGRSWERRPS